MGHSSCVIKMSEKRRLVLKIRYNLYQKSSHHLWHKAVKEVKQVLRGPCNRNTKRIRNRVEDRRKEPGENEPVMRFGSVSFCLSRPKSCVFLMCRVRSKKPLLGGPSDLGRRVSQRPNEWHSFFYSTHYFTTSPNHVSEVYNNPQSERTFWGSAHKNPLFFFGVEEDAFVSSSCHRLVP